VRVPTLPPIQGVDTCGDSATCTSNAAVKNRATIPATPEISAEVGYVVPLNQILGRETDKLAKIVPV